MTMPPWVSRTGLLYHGLVGFLLTLWLAAWGVHAWGNLWAIIGIGIAHELGDGDFTTEAGHPWNGVLDCAAFLIAPIIYLVIS